jgi:predicted transcriptional regulator
MTNDELTIPQVAKELGFTIQYVRYLIRTGKLSSILRPIFEGASTQRHMISSEEIARYLSEAHTHSRRNDRRNKFIFYATPEEYTTILALVREANLAEVADTMLPANTVKAMGFLRSSNSHGTTGFVK